MKNLFVVAIAIALSAGICGQESDAYIGKGYYVLSKTNDTVRTFNFMQADIDACRGKLVDFWGMSEYNTCGKIKWTNIEIDPIGKGLEIYLYDQFCLKKGSNMTCKPFKDDQDKNDKMKNIAPNQYRDVTITFKDISGDNLSLDNSEIDYIAQLLLEIIQ